MRLDEKMTVDEVKKRCNAERRKEYVDVVLKNRLLDWGKRLCDINISSEDTIIMRERPDGYVTGTIEVQMFRSLTELGLPDEIALEAIGKHQRSMDHAAEWGFAEMSRCGIVASPRTRLRAPVAPAPAAASAEYPTDVDYDCVAEEDVSEVKEFLRVHPECYDEIMKAIETEDAKLHKLMRKYRESVAGTFGQ